MKKVRNTLILILIIGLNILNAQTNKLERILQPEDKLIVEKKLNLFSSKSNLPISELITEIGLSFLGTPYVAATLENGLDEKLVINLRELDCTTFVENCLALARTVKLGNIDLESFAAQLEKIRYRDGIRNQYPSRLHYFSEWIQNNHKKGFISETPNQKGVKSVKNIDFMSTHPASYPVLKEHPELVLTIAEQEKDLSNSGFMYFPKNKLSDLYANLLHGDIIALTSSIAEIDINHVGIIIKKSTEFYLLHASLSGKKVLISDSPLTDFLKPESKNDGIMIARPVFSLSNP